MTKQLFKKICYWVINIIVLGISFTVFCAFFIIPMLFTLFNWKANSFGVLGISGYENIYGTNIKSELLIFLLFVSSMLIAFWLLYSSLFLEKSHFFKVQDFYISFKQSLLKLNIISLLILLTTYLFYKQELQNFNYAQKKVMPEKFIFIPNVINAFWYILLIFIITVLGLTNIITYPVMLLLLAIIMFAMFAYQGYLAFIKSKGQEHFDNWYKKYYYLDLIFLAVPGMLYLNFKKS